ncbi:unnamed protein product [Brassica oleracea]
MLRNTKEAEEETHVLSSDSESFLTCNSEKRWRYYWRGQFCLEVETKDFVGTFLYYTEEEGKKETSHG